VSKYHAKRTNGYASKKEANRAAELQALARCGAILALQEQVPFQLLPADPANGYERPLIYIADFCYIAPPCANCEVPIRHVEDVKGFRTPVYKLKKRLMLQLLGVEIEEV
jgi:Protein of unknown function (DUF1064)